MPISKKRHNLNETLPWRHHFAGCCSIINYIYIHIHTHTLIYIYIIYIHIKIYKYVYIYIYLFIYVFIYLHVIYIYIYIYCWFIYSYICKFMLYYSPSGNSSSQSTKRLLCRLASGASTESSAWNFWRVHQNGVHRHTTSYPIGPGRS